jgi:hypothetical protein
MKGRGGMSALILISLGLVPGCDEQQVTDTVNAYQAALVAGDGRTACSYATPQFRKRLSGREIQGSPSISCPRQVAYLHSDPGFLSVNKEIAVTGVAVHGDKAQVHTRSLTKAMVTGEYFLVRRGGDWKIAKFFGTS